MKNMLRDRPCIGIIMVLSLIVRVPHVYAEAYISAQVGATAPSVGKGLSNGEYTEFSPPGKISDRELQSSLVLGFKSGYYFPRARWFGLETEVFHATPHIKQQQTSLTIQPGTVFRDLGPVPGSGTASGVLTGDHFRVITWAPVNFMFRYHRTRLQPYVGVGPGVFFGRITSTAPGFEGSQSSTRLGLNTKAGLDYFVTRHLSLFGEWKYTRVKFNFPANPAQFEYAVTYDMHMGVFGLSYHF